MPRPTRLELPAVPQHVIQRGNDRQPFFYVEGDYLRYRTDLRELARRESCAVHAYVLMTNHVHILMTPAVPSAVARVMQSLGRRYVRYINDRYHRTGTLWEGRYKSCLVDDGDYLLHCYRYIELNPLRAAMVADPRDYPWSSHRKNECGEHDPLVSPHPAYLALSVDLTRRQQAYWALVMETVDPLEVAAIRQHVQSPAGLRHRALPRSDRSSVGTSGRPSANRQAAKVRPNRGKSTLPPVL